MTKIRYTGSSILDYENFIEKIQVIYLIYQIKANLILSDSKMIMLSQCKTMI